MRINRLLHSSQQARVVNTLTTDTKKKRTVSSTKTVPMLQMEYLWHSKKAKPMLQLHAQNQAARDLPVQDVHSENMMEPGT